MLDFGFDISVNVRPHRSDHVAAWTVGPVSERDLDAKPTKKRRPHRRRRPHSPEEIRMNLRDDQKVALAVQFKDRVGNTVSPEDVGTLTFTSSDESIVTVTDNGDGTAVATTVGPLGEAVVTVTNDFNDDGTDDFSGSIAIAVVAGDVAEVSLAAGEPVSRFEDAPPVEPEEPPVDPGV